MYRFLIFLYIGNCIRYKCPVYSAKNWTLINPCDSITGGFSVFTYSEQSSGVKKERRLPDLLQNLVLK